ncbi:MAG: glucosaminidase domain-containing protein [Propionibacteriaceae bacterium]|nr:glucosaminidase domain-containing protein [Propionibacteriaceae bacterium]
MTTSHNRFAALGMALLLALLGLGMMAPQASASQKKLPEEFIAWVAPMAQRGEREFQVPASVAIAQAILESGWGGSRLTREANSFFGIKCHKTQSPHQNGCHEIETREYDAAGNPRVEVARFRSYASPEDSFLDHGYFLRNTRRYRSAFKYSGNPERFIHEVHKAGYATDPSYAHLVATIIRKYGLSRFDVTPRDDRELTPSAFGTLDREVKAGSRQRFILSVNAGHGGSITWQVSRDGSTWRNVKKGSLRGVHRSIYERTVSTKDEGLRIRAVVANSVGTTTLSGQLHIS